MELLNQLMNAQGGSLVEQLAKQFNLESGQAQSAIAGLLPALTGGVKNNTQKAGGMESLLGALQKGGHDRYLDQPDQLNQASAIEDGNKILGHLLGSKQRSREVAQQTAQSTGVPEGVLKQMLPVVANLAMGAMSKNQQQAGSTSGFGKMLGTLIDQDGDGSVADDVMDFARKLF